MDNIEERIKLNEVKVIEYKDYDGEFLYDDNTENFFSCIDTMEDYYKDNNLIMPKYTYGCYFIPFTLDLENFLEYEAQEHHEDILDSLEDVSELGKAIEKFNESNKSNGSYTEDIRTIIKLS